MKLFVKYQNIFEIEKLRDKLAREDNLKDFTDTYLFKPKDIVDINTNTFWNRKHRQDYNKLIHSPIYIDKINIVCKWLLKNRGSILDVGFGNGEIEKRLQIFNLHPNGVDLSVQSVKNAKKNYKGVFRVGNIYKIPFKSKSFDTILILDVLEHVPPGKIFKAYKEIGRVLKNNGTLIMSIPLNEGLDKLLRKGQNPNGHLRVYTFSILKAELKIVGFTVFRERYLYAFREFYVIKKIISMILPMLFLKPNLMIAFAQKK